MRQGRSAHGVQSGEQTERNPGQLRTTDTVLRCRTRSGSTRSLRLGAGRSQVQILSPRLECCKSRSSLNRRNRRPGPIGPSGSNFCNRARNGAWRGSVDSGRLCAPGPFARKRGHPLAVHSTRQQRIRTPADPAPPPRQARCQRSLRARYFIDAGVVCRAHAGSPQWLAASGTPTAAPWPAWSRSGSWCPVARSARARPFVDRPAVAVGVGEETDAAPRVLLDLDTSTPRSRRLA
jgi:hypothetical protein